MAQTVACNVCPHNCVLESEGDKGKCHVRERRGHKVVLAQYGYCSTLAVEPIEKRPLFHYLPGSKFLSVGFYGCSLTCNFCQNFSVSQTYSDRKKIIQPKELIDLSISKGTSGIVFTYNEPTVHYEYLVDVGVASLLCDPRPHLAIKTNGFASHAIVRNLALFFKAWNVDIKGDEEEYQKICGGGLYPVLDTIELLSTMGVHLEISYLVLPRLINDMAYHEEMRDFLADVDPQIPVHVLYFYPSHKMTDPSYQHTELLKIVDLFRVRMDHVYVSNSYNTDLMPYRHTTCVDCGKLLIKRSRQTTVESLECCGKKIRGTFL